MQLTLLICLTIIQSYLLSRTTADADWAMFNFANFTGSWYGRDFADCKTPGIHLYYWLIGKLVGKSIPRVKFADHVLTALPGIIYYQISGDFTGALIYVAIVNSPHFYSFTGNVGHLAAALLMMAMISTSPHMTAVFLLASIFVEPKLLPGGMAMAIIGKMWLTIPWLFIGLVFALLIIFMISKTSKHQFKEVASWVIESSITIPIRMSKYRKSIGKWMPWYTSDVVLYVGPFMAAAILARPDLNYWLPMILYFAVIAAGFFIRAYHLILFVPFIALAGMDQTTAMILIAIDLISCGFYLGDIWERHYRFYANHVKAGRDTGLYLKDKPGTVWVNGMHSEIYVYAQKPVPFGLAEQIEINDVATERRDRMVAEWKIKQPDYVVITENPRMDFKPSGYKMAAQSFNTVVWQKVV